MSVTPAAGGTPQGSFATEEKAKLRKVLRRPDLVLFATAAVITLETLAATASSGGQAIVWLVVTFFIFFLPYSLLVAELGTTFPLEGGPYEWARRAFGRLAGSMTALFYWIAQPIWLGGLLTATAVAAINSLIVTKPLSTAAEIIFGMVFVWAVIAVPS
jgi:amino acid transporter